MRPRCPCCQRSQFSYSALRAIHPFPGEVIPSELVCPACKAALKVTIWSRVSGLLLAVVPVVVVATTLKEHTHVATWVVPAAAMLWFALYYFALWPNVVRLTLWSPYWLPGTKNSTPWLPLIIASVLALVALFFYFATKFMWGM